MRRSTPSEDGMVRWKLEAILVPYLLVRKPTHPVRKGKRAGTVPITIICVWNPATKSKSDLQLLESSQSCWYSGSLMPMLSVKAYKLLNDEGM